MLNRCAGRAGSGGGPIRAPALCPVGTRRGRRQRRLPAPTPRSGAALPRAGRAPDGERDRVATLGVLGYQRQDGGETEDRAADQKDGLEQGAHVNHSATWKERGRAPPDKTGDEQYMRHTSGPGCAIQPQRLISCYLAPGIIAPAMEKAGGRSRPKRVGQWHPRGGGRLRQRPSGRGQRLPGQHRQPEHGQLHLRLRHQRWAGAGACPVRRRSGPFFSQKQHTEKICGI
jgi:hypothetical protein